MEIALTIHITAALVAAGRRNIKACRLQLSQRKQTATFPDELEIPAVGEMVEDGNSAERVDPHPLIVRLFTASP